MSTEQQVPSLRSRIVTATSWVLGGDLVAQALRLGSNLIMTRLLVPEMFGVMALANVLLIGLSLFSDIGLSQNIVQSRRGNDPVFLNTAWTIQIIRGALIGLLAIMLALVLYFMNVSGWLPEDSVYAEPILPYIMAVLSLNAVIGGFTSTKLATANRSLSMGRVTRIELLSQVAGLVFMITWALIDRSIWALVMGSLVAALFKMLLSHFLLPGEKNRLYLEIQAFWEIFHFGKWIFLTSILGFLAMNGDRLLLGTLTDSATLGIYAIAYFMVHAIERILAKVIGKVSFPALSEIVRERREALKTVYYKFRLPVDIATLFFTGLLFASGHLLIQLLYDERYLAAGHMLEILSLSLFAVRFSVDSQCYMALGKPRLLIPLVLVRILALFGLMPLAFHTWGLSGAVWVAGVSSFFSIPITFYFRIQYNLFDLKRELVVLPLLVVGYLFGLIINQVARIIV